MSLKTKKRGHGFLFFISRIRFDMKKSISMSILGKSGNHDEINIILF